MEIRLTEAEMARAMYASDTAYDGLFYTCVTSTGIFCFPSCPARKPQLKNVRFARTRDEAITWGFRPCKRCRPDLDAGRRGYEQSVVVKAQALIDVRLERITVADLASAMSLSVDHLRRLFRRTVGTAIHEYILRRRVDRARQRLEAGGESVLDIGLEVGFDSPSAFYAAFNRIVGMSPGVYRQRIEQEAAKHGA